MSHGQPAVSSCKPASLQELCCAVLPRSCAGRNLNDKLNIACIGVGGRGAPTWRECRARTSWRCAMFPRMRSTRQRRKHPQARKFSDFRRVFDHAREFRRRGRQHLRAHARLRHAAGPASMGKHVYCEKPLTHNIWEARVIREAAAKTKVATQMGIQIHASDNYRRVVELIQARAIGPVREAHVWVSRAWGWQSEEDAKKHQDIVSVQERPTEEQPVPTGSNWDLWLGPAPERPFNDVYVPGPKWYRWWDFGNGTMTDLGSHWNDLPFWALKLQAPLTIEATGPPPHAEIAPGFDAGDL